MPNASNVLIVDDEPGILKTLTSILLDKGMSIAQAYNGVKAVEAMTNHQFDTVLLDIMMPEMNEVDALIEIKRINPQAKIIMMTGFGKNHPLVKQALESGVDKLLEKPFDLDELLDCIESVHELMA
ncbi:MAG: response regulator [Chloroflexi bacterium]|nr:response regulator [Chloroflexota bacterium]MBT7290385.1 response regulator [Chloroflexota bacterium]